MKTPRNPVSHLLFKSKPTNHAQNLSSIPHLLGTPPRFLSNSPLIPQFSNTHELASQIPPKPTSRCNQTLTNGFFSAKLLDYMAKSKPFSAKFQFDKMSNGFSQRRSISSTQSDPLGSDAVPVVSTVNSSFQGSTPIDAGSSIRKPISLWHGMYHSPVTNALWEARSKFFEKSSNGSENGNAHSELIVKNPLESRTSISYKFSSDYILREQYRNPWNEIRMGNCLKILMLWLELYLSRCGAQQSGDLGPSDGALDGILGFGKSNSSMLSQLASSGRVKKIFAHCLDGVKGGGIFAIAHVVQPQVNTTPLVPNQ